MYQHKHFLWHLFSMKGTCSQWRQQWCNRKEAHQNAVDTKITVHINCGRKHSEEDQVPHQIKLVFCQYPLLHLTCFAFPNAHHLILKSSTFLHSAFSRHLFAAKSMRFGWDVVFKSNLPSQCSYRALSGRPIFSFCTPTQLQHARAPSPKHLEQIINRAFTINTLVNSSLPCQYENFIQVRV